MHHPAQIEHLTYKLLEQAVDRAPHHLDNPLICPSRRSLLSTLHQVVEIVIKEHFAAPYFGQLLQHLVGLFSKDPEAQQVILLWCIRYGCETVPLDFIEDVMRVLLGVGANPKNIENMTNMLASSWVIGHVKKRRICNLLI